jgi:hypothetical protein
VLSHFVSGPSRLCRVLNPLQGCKALARVLAALGDDVRIISEPRNTASVISDAVTQEVAPKSGIDETQIVA